MSFVAAKVDCEKTHQLMDYLYAGNWTKYGGLGWQLLKNGTDMVHGTDMVLIKKYPFSKDPIGCEYVHP